MKQFTEAELEIRRTARLKSCGFDFERAEKTKREMLQRKSGGAK